MVETISDFEYLADRPDLIQTCAEWAFGAWGRYNAAATLEKRVESFQQHCNKTSIPLTLLAMQSHTLVGTASLRENDGIRSDLRPWLGGLYVDKDSRGAGVGEKLISAIKSAAHSLGHQELYLLTYEASLPQWYGSLGWKEIGKDELFGSPVTIMKTKLAG